MGRGRGGAAPCRHTEHHVLLQCNRSRALRTCFTNVVYGNLPAWLRIHVGVACLPVGNSSPPQWNITSFLHEQKLPESKQTRNCLDGQHTLNAFSRTTWRWYACSEDWPSIASTLATAPSSSKQPIGQPTSMQIDHFVASFGRMLFTFDQLRSNSAKSGQTRPAKCGFRHPSGGALFVKSQGDF